MNRIGLISLVLNYVQPVPSGEYCGANITNGITSVSHQCFCFIIWEHGVNDLESIRDKINQNNIHIAKQINFNLPSNKFKEFIRDVYPDTNKKDILAKNKYIIEKSEQKNNVRAVLLLVRANSSSLVHSTKISIRNIYNPKFRDLNQQIPPLNRGVSHNHVIHSTDSPTEFTIVYNVIGKYSSYISKFVTIAQMLTKN